VFGEAQRKGLWLALLKNTLAQFHSTLSSMAIPVQPRPLLALTVGEVSKEADART
jgi:hypothetical protein